MLTKKNFLRKIRKILYEHRKIGKFENFKRYLKSIPFIRDLVDLSSPLGSFTTSIQILSQLGNFWRGWRRKGGQFLRSPNRFRMGTSTLITGVKDAILLRSEIFFHYGPILLRIDASVDRTQCHNVFVMGNVVHKNARVSTIFIGFDVPKEGKSLGYYECAKALLTIYCLGRSVSC